MQDDNPHEPCSHGRTTGPCEHETRGACGTTPTAGLSRRRLLGGVAAGAALALAGCSETTGPGGETTTADLPDAITLTTDDACEVCGMIIPNHPGPTTEIFYPDNEPSGHENPARFDSTWEAFQYDFERQDRGWERSVMYVTDYSTVEYDVFEDEGTTMISTHPEADAFTTASEVTFVAGSSVEGAMGQDLIAFSADDDAGSFADEYGGERVAVEDVTPELIAQLGM
ncbi:nitrous oxide reductase accessory protein NosL [Halorientalis salina]|uniref:nitrous oxide reductase accessory protein NosL n=1 Tax=Halorientalis salina TaxID=2932266 RepID=UPI0010AC671A|nr:nitrous oxide reductase accessory protein NosL [Halorientalis salina]